MRRDGRAWHGGRVLVCEPNLLMAEVICQFLPEWGLEAIGPVDQLESALHMARVRALDGAILNIDLNGRPCFPVCAILSARRVPFAFLTSHSGQAVLIPVEYRWAAIVAKPFEPSEMKDVLAQMLGLTDRPSPTARMSPTLRH